MRRSVECGQGSAHGLREKGPLIAIAVSRHGIPGPTAPVLYSALVDTGACPSFIDVSIAEELGLRFIDKGKSRNVFGAREVRIYAASIEICQLKYKRRAPFPAIDLIGAGMPFKAIIGRDFLSELNMDYDGWTGRVTLRRLGMSGA